MSTVFVAKLGPEDPAQGLMNQALAFFNAGSRCMADISITPTVTNSPMAPAVVCFAFSAELYLKLLHLISIGNPDKIHGLKEIFAVLPEATRQKVGSRYPGGLKNLEAEIKAVSSAFVDWRYLHEIASASINPQTLANIARAAHVVCRELRADLRVFGENAPAR